MRGSSPLLIAIALAVASVAQIRAAAQAQTAAVPSATAPKAAVPYAGTRTVAAPLPPRKRAQPTGLGPSRRAPKSPAADLPRGSAPAGKRGGVLALGATDITGNKELPKVMVIVPWKPSSGAGGVIPPADSLLDETLEPLDRGVFQRRIRYYGQLEATDERPAASRTGNSVREPGPVGQSVAPVGDSR